MALKSGNTDWFRESAADLEPILQRRNKLYSKWLATKRPTDQLRFWQARGQAHTALHETKNKWFQAKAEEAQKAHFGMKKVWQCIREM